MFFKKVFLKSWQISQENTCVVVSFLIKLKTFCPPTWLKKDSNKSVSCEICKSFRNTFFEEHLWTNLSGESKKAYWGYRQVTNNWKSLTIFANYFTIDLWQDPKCVLNCIKLMEGIWNGEDTEALIQSCSVKKIFLRTSQNSLKNTCVSKPWKMSTTKVGHQRKFWVAERLKRQTSDPS